MMEKLEILREYQCNLANIIEVVKEIPDANDKMAKTQTKCIKYLEKGDRLLQKLLLELLRDDGHGNREV